MTGLNTFSSKWPCEPAKVRAALLPNTCTHTIVSASHCVGLTLPGMMDEPGSFSGRDNSPRPERGPEPRKRMSLAILKSEAATVLIAPWLISMASCAASASNLLGAVVKGSLVIFAMRFATSSANPIGAFKPVPTAVPPCASCISMGSVCSILAMPFCTCCA